MDFPQSGNFMKPRKASAGMTLRSGDDKAFYPRLRAGQASRVDRSGQQQIDGGYMVTYFFV